jgi:hypothetical protein
MSLPRFVEIDGRRYLWRDLVALRQSQACPVPNAAAQDTGMRLGTGTIYRPV